MPNRSEITTPQIREGERRLAAIAFTDVVGYSGVVHRDEKLGQRMLHRQAAVVRAVLPLFGGREVRLTGDGFLLEFGSALSAVKALVTIQTRLATDDQASACPVTLRTSVHLGDVDHVAGDVYGDGVNLAARLMPLSPEGGLAISATVLMQVRQQLSLEFRSIGTPPLKNIVAPLEVFVADPPAVLVLGKELAAATPDEVAGPPPVRSARRWVWPAAAAAVALIVGIGAVLVVQRARITGTAPATPQSSQVALAVLPFANSSGDPANEYFSDGLSEELIGSLGRIPALKVMGRTSSFQFKNSQEGPRAIGEKLGVGYLVDGSVRKGADHVRIGVALVRTDDGSNLWSDSYDRELKDVLGVQTEIATAVTGQLQRMLALPSTPPPAGTSKVGLPPGGNVEAYQALLQGNFYARRENADDLLKAIQFYEQAVKLDPRYALALARFAYADFVYSATFAASRKEDRDALVARARAAVAAALELDPDLAEAHLAQAYDLSLIQQQIEPAEREYRRATELAPRNPDMLGDYGSFLFERGKIAPALEMFDRAVALDPLSRGAHLRRGRLLSLTSRLDEAMAEVLKARDLEPQSAVTNAELAIIKLRQGDAAAAAGYARQEHDPFWRTWSLAMAAYANHDGKEADAALDQLVRENASDGPFQIAEVYAFRKDPDAAFHWLDRALEAKDPGVTQLYASRTLLLYRDDPRFAAYARKVGLDPAQAPTLGK